MNCVSHNSNGIMRYCQLMQTVHLNLLTQFFRNFVITEFCRKPRHLCHLSTMTELSSIKKLIYKEQHTTGTNFDSLFLSPYQTIHFPSEVYVTIIIPTVIIHTSKQSFSAITQIFSRACQLTDLYIFKQKACKYKLLFTIALLQRNSVTCEHCFTGTLLKLILKNLKSKQAN